MEMKIPSGAGMTHHSGHQPGWKILLLQNYGIKLHSPRQTPIQGAPSKRTPPYIITFTPYQRTKWLLFYKTPVKITIHTGNWEPFSYCFLLSPALQWIHRTRYVWRLSGTLKRAMRTKQFTVGDVSFCKGGYQLPHNSPLHLLLQVESATLNITNQNNRRMGQAIHHEYFASHLCPCMDLSRWIHHILINRGSIASHISKCRVTGKDPFSTVIPTYLITSL